MSVRRTPLHIASIVLGWVCLTLAMGASCVVGCMAFERPHKSWSNEADMPGLGSFAIEHFGVTVATARDIHIQRDIDTNDEIISFQFEPSECDWAAELTPRSPEEAHGTNLRLPFLVFDYWWPSALSGEMTAGELRASGLRLYTAAPSVVARVSEGMTQQPAYWAVDCEQGVAYAWVGSS